MLTMRQSLKAVFQYGVFVPATPCDLPDGTSVELDVRAATLTPPEVIDPVERTHLMEQLLQSMSRNLLSAEAPQWSREDLHERR